MVGVARVTQCGVTRPAAQEAREEEDAATPGLVLHLDVFDRMVGELEVYRGCWFDLRCTSPARWRRMAVGERRTYYDAAADGD